jgi:WhiB family transcriptional regulator, redox-sensing transcriptional regulator
MNDTRGRSAKGGPMMSVSAAFQAAPVGWQSLGACRDSDPDLFFPIAASGPGLRQIAEAKAVCARCPVRIVCLSYALDTGQHAGVWGGASAEERQGIRSARAVALTLSHRHERGPTQEASIRAGAGEREDADCPAETVQPGDHPRTAASRRPIPWARKERTR